MKIKQHLRVALQSIMATFLVALVVAGAVEAATTIGNNISTGTITSTGAITSGGAVAVTGNVTATARVGVASTTPYAVLSVEAADGRPAFTVGSTSNAVHYDMLSIAENGALTFNGVGALEADITVQGDSVTNLFVSDASADRIGIASTTPWGLLSVEQGTEESSFVVGNTGSSTPAFVVKGVGTTRGGARVGVGTTTPAALFAIGQDVQGTGTTTPMFMVGFNNSSAYTGTSTIDLGKACFRFTGDSGNIVYMWYSFGGTSNSGAFATSTTSCY